jgi:hypothetical protein
MNLLFWRKKSPSAPRRSAEVTLAERALHSVASDRREAVAALPSPQRQVPVGSTTRTAAQTHQPTAQRAPQRRPVPAPVAVDVLVDPSAAPRERLSAIDSEFLRHERELQERKIEWAAGEIAKRDEALRQAEDRVAAAQQRAASLEARLRESEARSAERLTQIGQPRRPGPRSIACLAGSRTSVSWTSAAMFWRSSSSGSSPAGTRSSCGSAARPACC